MVIMDFAGIDIISAKQFSREDLEYIMDWAIKI